MAKRTHQLRVLVGLTLLWMGAAAWVFFVGGHDVTFEVVDHEGNPVANAAVVVEDDELGVTDATGTVEVSRIGADTVTIRAIGYQLAPIDLRYVDEVERVHLQPQLLRGVVHDSEGLAVEGAVVSAGAAQAVTDADGRFTVVAAQPGSVSVWRPAWEEIEIDWDGSPGQFEVGIDQQVVKAVHVSGEAASEPARWRELVEMTNTTELNAIMLDLKDETGLVWFDTANATAVAVGAVEAGYDLAAAVADADAADAYIIGRLVTFQDPIAAVARPAMAVIDGGTGQPYSNNGQYFLDPTDDDARTYALELAEEACRAGLDEIQFDYIRYPDGFPASAIFDGGSDQEVRVETISSFLREARTMLHPLGCAVAADIFGFITRASDDGGIGQQWEVLTEVLDVASPMLYPSHYSTGWYGYDDPGDHPGDVVYQALADGLARRAGGVIVRPWLQDFGYDASQVRSQIEAAESFGLGWMLWNATSNVSMGALDPGE